MSELSGSCGSPGVNPAGALDDGNGVRLSSSDLRWMAQQADLFDPGVFQRFDELGTRHVGAPVLVLGHEVGIRVSELSTATAAPAVESTLCRTCDAMCISGGDLDDSDLGKGVHQRRDGLVRKTFLVRGQVLDR
jgi:hypothetical protein